MNFIILNYFFWDELDVGSNRWNQMGHLLAATHAVTAISADGDLRRGDAVRAVHVPGNTTREGQVSGFRRSRLPAWRRSRLFRMVRDLVFFPDHQIFWSQRAAQAISRCLSTTLPNVLITSSPIHSVHVPVARIIDSLSPRPLWIMDLRDPWTTDPAGIYSQKWPPFLYHRERQLEAFCHRKADATTVIGPSFAEIIQQAFGIHAHVVCNGYMAAQIWTSQISDTAPLTLRYFGRIIPGIRDPGILFAAAAALCLTPSDLVFEFWSSDPAGIQETAARCGVTHLVRTYPRVAHAEALCLERTAYANLVLNGTQPATDHILTTKLFEFLASGRPVVAVTGVQSDMANVLKDCGCDAIVSDIRSAKEALVRLRERKLGAPNANRLHYTRESAVDDLLKIITAIVTKDLNANE
ncbi:MAG: hypothetical protein L6428_02905 [Candidatus Aminicenantes bacterium]|nr:hypothetical protein [Candidatus Aminicenantes bacterium]